MIRPVAVRELIARAVAHSILAFLLAAAVSASGCGKTSSPAPASPATRTAGGDAALPIGNAATRLDAPPGLEPAQGLTADEREQFYHLAMGSELFPLEWIQALVSQQTGKPFLEEIDRFGLLPDPTNADGLPVGMSAAASRDLRFAGRMIGFNCAVCHVGELTYRGKRVRIDGGSSLFQVTAFATDLAESAAATATDVSRLYAFLGRLHEIAEQDRRPASRAGVRELVSAFRNFDALKTAGELEQAFAEHLESLVGGESDRAAPDLNAGLTVRKDAGSRGLPSERLRSLIGEIKTGDLGEVLEKRSSALVEKFRDREAALRGTIEETVEIARLLKARAEFARKMGSLKQIGGLEGGPGRVDDFGSARNVLFDLKYARPGTAPCSIPPLWNSGLLEWSDWDNNTTSAMGRSMATALAAGAAFDPATFLSTVPPRALDQHESITRKIRPPVWPDDVFGTIDRARAARGSKLFQQHCIECHVTDAEPPPDKRFDLDKIGTDPARALNFAEPLGDRPFADALEETVGKYMERAYAEDGVSDAEAARMEAGHPNKWRPTRQYAARPLTAVWATAPYLHNGSVPTLYDLLLPAADRPKSFPLGHREFDSVNVGFRTKIDGPAKFVFDTSLAGNRNVGHEFGTELTHDERLDLIEFLKSQ